MSLHLALQVNSIPDNLFDRLINLFARRTINSITVEQSQCHMPNADFANGALTECVKQFDYIATSEESGDKLLEDPSRVDKAFAAKDAGRPLARRQTTVKISYKKVDGYKRGGWSYERGWHTRGRSLLLRGEPSAKSLHPSTKGLDGFPEV